MIVTRTPFRITLGGGGTDLPSFYEQHGGFVFAMGIDKYMYIMLNPPTVDRTIRLHYSRIETVADVDELNHDLAREALRLHGIRNGLEVSSMADLPDGTGLGSSGSYLVGLLMALHRHRRNAVTPEQLAEEACHIELDVLAKPVGKQDQYMAAFGGLTKLDIARDGRVSVRAVGGSSNSLDTFIANTHLYFTGHRRSATDVLREQDAAMRALPERTGQDGGDSTASQAMPHGTVVDALLRIRELGYRILDAVERGAYDDWGRLLHEHWSSKKRLSSRISMDAVDVLYDHVRAEYGVLGGKIAGAGGGGFLMLYCPSSHGKLEQFMLEHGMPRLHYALAPAGAQVVADLRRTPALPAEPTVVVGAPGLL